MKRRKKFLLFTAAFLALWIFCGAKSANALVLVSDDVTAPQTWTRENSPYIIQNLIRLDAPVVIEAGTVIKFQNRESDTQPTRPGLLVENSFTAVGSPLESIVFTGVCDSNYGGDTMEYCSKIDPAGRGSWTGLIFGPSHQNFSTVEYVKIFYAMFGIQYSTNVKPEFPYHELSVKHSEISFCDSAAITLNYTQPTLDSLILTGNSAAFHLNHASSEVVAKIRNSVIVDNKKTFDYDYSPAFDARYNYWGDPSGPRYISYDGKDQSNPDGLGGEIFSSKILFRPWDRSDPTVPREPVIFIPGIGASINPDLMISGLLADNWTMFDHTYDGILQAFKSMGYQEGKNFFVVYYDWRQSNTESAKKYLEPVIQKALANNEADKVNIVTHSMGSLVARSYVQGSDYANNVDNLIMIAPPNRGSSDVYSLWEGGRIPNGWGSRGIVMKVYLGYVTMATSGTSNFYDTVHKFIPSLKDLMPVYDFLLPADDSQNLKSYFSMKEKNDFLFDLNKSVDDLSVKTRLSIILGDKQPTVDKIPTIFSGENGLWADGKPDPIDPVRDDVGGDGEVLVSSGNISSDFLDVLDYGHSEIVSKSEKIVAQRLGESLDETFNSPEIFNELVFWTDAPGSLEVADPDGYLAPKDNNEDTDVRYAQEKNKDGFKITSVPNVKKGNYMVSIKGNDDGTYHLGVEYIDHKKENSDKEILETIEIKKDQTQILAIETDPESVASPIGNVRVRDENPPTITLQTPEDGKEYSNDQNLPIIFSVSDDISLKEKIQIEMYLDDDLQTENSIDLSKLSLGQHDFWVNAYDEAGNVNMAEAFFRVKQTPIVSSPAGDDDSSSDPPVKNEVDNNNNGEGGGVEEETADSGSDGNDENVQVPPNLSNGGGNNVNELITVNDFLQNEVENAAQTSKHKVNNKKSKKTTKNKMINGVGVTKSDEKIKILLSLNFNLSKNAEDKQNLYYGTLEAGLKDELASLDGGIGSGDEIPVAAGFKQQKSRFVGLSLNVDANPNPFKVPVSPTVFGIDDVKSVTHSSIDESTIVRNNVMENRITLLLEFAVALGFAIFPSFGYGISSANSVVRK